MKILNTALKAVCFAFAVLVLFIKMLLLSMIMSGGVFFTLFITIACIKGQYIITDPRFMFCIYIGVCVPIAIALTTKAMHKASLMHK